MLRARSLLPVTLASLLAACSDTSQSDATPRANSEPAETEPAKTEPAKTEPAKTEPTKTEPAKTEPAKTEPTKTVEAPPVDASPKPVEPTPVAPGPPEPMPGVVDIVPIPATASWTELPELAGKILDFEDVVLGVLAECGGDGRDSSWCSLDDKGALVACTTDEPDEFIGSWPDDAWRVESKSSESGEEEDYVMWADVDVLRWTGSKFERRDRTQIEIDPLSDMAGDPSYVFGKDWRGGMLVGSFQSITRLTSSGTESIDLGGDVYDVFATQAGALALTYEGDFQVALRGPCSDGKCPNPFPLPKPSEHAGADETFGWAIDLDVPRGKDGLTLLPERDPSLLLHYAPASSLVIERLPGSVDMLWPDEIGGLWTEFGDGLYYRQADGRWLAVEQPAGTPIHYAMQIEPRRLLALIDTSDGVRRVYALTGAPVAPGLAPTPPSSASH